ncbi:MAG: orotate phosphoribosyltransferase [Halanaerobiaceae bacterium]
MKEEKVREILIETGVLQEGHFVLSSGRHAGKYMQCALALQYPDYASRLAGGIASLWDKEEIETVTGPAIGAIVVSYVVGEALSVRSIFSERRDDQMQFRRGFDISPGEKVLLVEDVVTTGKSVREALNLLEDKGAEIIGVSSIVDRSGGKVDFGYPFRPLLTMEIESYSSANCPLCDRGMDFTKPGSRKNV